MKIKFLINTDIYLFAKVDFFLHNMATNTEVDGQCRLMR